MFSEMIASKCPLIQKRCKYTHNSSVSKCIQENDFPLQNYYPLIFTSVTHNLETLKMHFWHKLHVYPNMHSSDNF